MRFCSRRTSSAAFSSRSAGPANRENSAFRARKFNCRERTIRPGVIYYQRVPCAMSAIEPPKQHRPIATVARSPLRAHPASALWCTRGVWPAALPSPSLICELRLDLIVPTSTWSLIHGCMRPRDRLLRLKFKFMERHLFRSVQTLENALGLQNTAKKNRRAQSSLERGNAGRMSFCDLLMGSAKHGLAPSR